MSHYFTPDDVLNLYTSKFFTEEHDINYILSKIKNKKFTSYNQIRQLLDYGADNFIGFTVLENTDIMAQAINNNDIEVVGIILNTENFDIDDFDINHQTPLEIAIFSNNVDIVKLLLENRSTLYDEKEWLMKFPSLIAALENPKIDIRIIELLLQYGADNDALYHDYTPMIMAVKKNNIDAVYLLLESGANVNFQNRSLTTALIKASQNGNTEIVKLLLEYNAYTYIKDIFGNNALNYAKLNKFTNIIKLLK
jgi:ankyrin repeat protein